MNFPGFQNKMELYLNENSKKWFLPELHAQTKILLIMLIFPIIIYLLARKKQYHPYFYSLDSANNIKYVKKQSIKSDKAQYKI